MILCFYFLPFLLGSVISIFILPNIFLTIIAQIIFILMDYFYRLYNKNNNIHALLYIIHWTFIANVVSSLIVLLIRFAYEAYIECIYRFQRNEWRWRKPPQERSDEEAGDRGSSVNNGNRQNKKN